MRYSVDMINITAMPAMDNTTAVVTANVRAEMGRADMKAVQLAAAMGQNEMWLSRRLKGHVTFDVVDIQKIANVLHVPVGRLFTPDGWSHLSESNRRPVHYMDSGTKPAIVSLDVFRTRHEVADYTATSTSV